MTFGDFLLNRLSYIWFVFGKIALAALLTPTFSALQTDIQLDRYRGFVLNKPFCY